MSKEEYEIVVEIPDLKNARKSRCHACGEELTSFSVLVCNECLDEDCENFEKLTEKNI